MAEKRKGGNQAGRIAICALLFAILSQAVHTVGALIMMDYYTDPSNFHLWSPVMMGGDGGPSPEFFAASIGIGVLTGAIAAWAYYTVKASLPGEGIWKGVNFGILVFLLASVPNQLAMLLLFSIPPPLVLSWAVENVVLYPLGGALFARLIK